MPRSDIGRKFLGIHNGKEYYHDPRPVVETDSGLALPNQQFNKIVWRIPSVREAIKAINGHKILSADYSQIEVKLMAYLSQDPVLIAAINSGKDIHCYNAVEIFGHSLNFDYDLINKARKDPNHQRFQELNTLRTNIKRVTFGTTYGAGANKVAATTGMTPEQAQEFIDAFFSKFHVLKRCLDEEGSNAIRYGYSTSPRGRKRFYTLPRPDDKEAEGLLAQIRRWAGNFPIQSGNVDMLKPAMCGIYNELREKKYDPKDARILFCVHDEIVMTAREELCYRYDEHSNVLTSEELEVRMKDGRGYVKGPIEEIMSKNMQDSYSQVIHGIENKIDVAIGDIWAKA
jgi:DNA polymerase I-like protein with 3'-5' exonuclease and polymerase domains